MYSKFVLITCLVACAFAAPSTDVVPLEKQQPTVIPIVSQSEELEANGTYKFSYETGNGIKREEEAYEKILPKVEGRSASSDEGGESNESNEIHVQKGSYSYTAPDGTVITLSYIADENGFQPVGSHLPRAPVQVQGSTSSAEKSGRALKSLDSATSASAPEVKAPASEIKPASENKPASGNEPAPENKPAPEDKPGSENKPAPAESEPTLKNIQTTEEAIPKESTTESISENPAETKSTSGEPASTVQPSSQNTSAEIAEAPVSTTQADKITSVAPEAQTTVNPVSNATNQSGVSSTLNVKPALEEEATSTTASA